MAASSPLLFSVHTPADFAHDQKLLHDDLSRPFGSRYLSANDLITPPTCPSPDLGSTTPAVLPKDLTDALLASSLDERDLCDRVLAALSGIIPVERLPRQPIQSLLRDRVLAGADSAFYIVDLAIVVRQYIQWVQYLPRVKPFYAVKCNPNNGLVRTLKALGCGFDCASKREMEQVLEIGVKPDEVIFANPCKMKAHIEYARKTGVTMMTFDNADELHKVKKFHPDAKLVLRLLPPDSNSAVCCFGSKFGANSDQARHLLEVGHELGLNIIGCSFHVGSGCFSTDAYVGAITLARQVFDYGRTLGFSMNLLDIGGGWPGIDEVALPFTQIANVVRPLLDQLFDASVTIIAEPGRYFSSQCASLAVNVIAKRAPLATGNNVSSSSVLYYVGDGVYGSFNNTMFDHAQVMPQLLIPAPEEVAGIRPIRASTVFGPTCDSIDKIVQDVQLPDLNVGEWLWFHEMGAYTMASSSSFNGFEPPPAEFVMMY